jgi:hypothetical protein
MDAFIWTIFAHYIGDIALQSDFQAQNKGRLWYIMLSHCMIWAACVCISLEYLGLMAWWKPAFLVFGHWAMDAWKCKKPKTPEAWKYIYPDQIWHLIQCLIVFVVR